MILMRVDRSRRVRDELPYSLEPRKVRLRRQARRVACADGCEIELIIAPTPTNRCVDMRPVLDVLWIARLDHVCERREPVFCHFFVAGDRCVPYPPQPQVHRARRDSELDIA